MKKFLKKLLPYFLSIALIAVMMPLAFSSCELPDNPADDTAEKQAACEKLDSLADKSYSSVNLTITTEDDGKVLVSTYELTANTVEYSIEKLTSFTEEDGVIVAPDSYQETFTGTAEVKDNKVISLDGNLEMPAYDVLVGGFSFVYDNLTEYTLGEGTDTFKVTDATAFFGTNVDTADMSVSATYNDSALVSLTVTYTTGGVAVTLNYSYGSVAE